MKMLYEYSTYYGEEIDFHKSQVAFYKNLLFIADYIFFKQNILHWSKVQHLKVYENILIDFIDKNNLNKRGFLNYLELKYMKKEEKKAILKALITQKRLHKKAMYEECKKKIQNKKQ